LQLATSGPTLGRGKRPVIDVSWDDAQQYAAWISRVTRRPYRLLSEAEWEYAARAGTTSAYWWSNEIDETTQTAKPAKAPGIIGRRLPVGSFKANPFGLLDMLGNVWEWVEDCWHDQYRGAPSNGSAWTFACTDDAQRVVRGGGGR